jgi:arylsulfatase A-like enzyme
MALKSTFGSHQELHLRARSGESLARREAVSGLSRPLLLSPLRALGTTLVLLVFVQLAVGQLAIGQTGRKGLEKSNSGAVDKLPNIVFILADDLGWSDTTLYDTTKLYETPNIQRLAQRGMTFTKAYSSSPLCSPTRCSILTGLSPARTGLTAPNAHLPKVVLAATPGNAASPSRKAVPVNSVTRIDPKYYTLSERLHDQGYATGHFGKWHLGHSPFSPLENGFDVDIPHWHGPGPAGSFVAPWRYPDFDPDTPDEHIEDRMAKEAASFIKANADRPFFLNYWMFSVHAPFDAKPDLIEKYRRKIAAVDPNSPQRCPTYAAMVHSMDDAVGTLLDEIDRLGIADNTIIIFASDNGGNMYDWVDNTVPTSNAPLRGGKASMYEGGVRGPCSIVWPGNVKPDSRSDQPIQSCDFYPTILEMLSLDPRPDQSFDGISIVPTLQGESQQRDEIYTYFPHSPKIPDWLPPAVSVVKGDWKLIRLFHGGDNGQHRWKLYNLDQDIGETNDVASDHPAKVAQLDALIENFLVDTQAVTPTANPKFNPRKYDLNDEGKAEPHGKNKRAAKVPEPGKRVAGWLEEKECQLSVSQGRLMVECLGRDPYLSAALSDPLDPGDYVVKITMASDGSTEGNLFWQELNVNPKYQRNRKKEFEIKNDGQFHTYSVKLDFENPVIGLRLDPSTQIGTVSIEALEVQSSGATVRKWDFESSKP